MLVDGDEPARFDQVTTGRAAIFTAGRPAARPPRRLALGAGTQSTGADVEAARQQLQRLMRDAEADIAEALSNDGWLTVLDGPLHGIRHRRGLPVIGYVKTHHPRMLAREHWVRVPELTAGERSGLFATKDALDDEGDNPPQSRSTTADTAFKDDLAPPCPPRRARRARSSTVQPHRHCRRRTPRGAALESAPGRGAAP